MNLANQGLWPAVFGALLGLVASVSCAQTKQEKLTQLRPDDPRPVESSELEKSIARGVQHLIETQRQDGAWGGPQWTGGVDSDPVPGAFHSFDVAVTAMCLEALLDAEPSSEVRQTQDRAFQFLNPIGGCSLHCCRSNRNYN